MKQKILILIGLIFLSFESVPIQAQAVSPSVKNGIRMVDTRSGTLEFEPNGYPTQTTVADVQAEMDYQRAVQAYLQLLPAVGVM